MSLLLVALGRLETLVGKYSDDQPRDDSGRWSGGGGGGGGSSESSSGRVALRPASGRVFSGRPVSVRTRLSKLETGTLGEDIATAWLKSQGSQDAASLNVGRNNFPVDLIQDHEVVEVKAGLVSNRQDTQRWRLSIGEPGPAEKAWLARATPSQKARLNLGKSQAIVQRKELAMRQIAAARGGRTPKASTIGIILNPDTKTADIYKFNGFHERIGWNSEQARAGYVTTVRYGR